MESRGTEIELNFNPNKYWTVQSSFSDTETINTNVNPATTDWIARRMPFWTKIVDPRTGTLWWDTSYGGNTAHSYFTNSVDLPFKILQQQQGKSNPQIRRYRVKASTNYQLAGLTQHRILRNFNVGGAVRWEDKGGIGYYGVQKFPASITELDPNRPIYDKAHYYVDAFVSYRLKLFANKVGASIQLNARNLGENGRLQPVGAFPNGTPLAYRIVDPALYILQVKFDL